MQASPWNTCGLLILSVLGIGVVVSTTATAETKKAKPPARGLVQHQRAVPRLPAVPRRLIPQQNVGRRIEPANNGQRGNGMAVGRPPLGPQMRNPAAVISRGPNGSASGPRPRQSLTPSSLRIGTARTPNATRPLSALSAGQPRPRSFAATGNARIGSLANRRRGGNGAPPGVRLIDMRVMPLPPGSGLPPLGEARFRSSEVVLQFGAGRTPQEVAAIAQRFGLSVVTQQTIGALRRTVYTFRITNGQPVANVIRQIEGAGLNASAQPNYTYGLTQDVREDRAGAGVAAGDPAQYVVAKLHLEAAHRITTGKDVVIALIDSRVDLRQPDFAGRIVETYDAGCGTGAPDAHGTGMAGAIASHAGLLGVAPNAKIIAICAFGGAGTPEATSAKIIRGVDYAIQHGAKIINMSFAGPHDPALAQALQIAREKGILIVAAAGNAGAKSPPLYPGADPNVLAVTATDEHDRLFAGANQGQYVALAAPGVNILVPAPRGGVQLTTGTSVATAHVSGVAALLVAEESSRTPEDIRAILVGTAKHLGANGINPQFGAGLIDPLKALRSAPEIVSQMSAHVAPTPQSH